MKEGGFTVHRSNPDSAKWADPDPLPAGINVPFASIRRIYPAHINQGGGIHTAPRRNHPASTGGFTLHQNPISALLKVIHRGVLAAPAGGFKAHRIRQKRRSAGGFTPHQKCRFSASVSYPQGGSSCTGFNGPKTPKSYPQGGLASHRKGVQGTPEGGSGHTLGGFKAHRGGTRK